ncbi:MAG: pro-sigmaK processing inhibitor BofA family protein [Oscillospiraceae bacterium]|nr:pro-sigmaK processing inhibitor BofA family protein [Oscillospiraceae bacterium]
MIWAAAALLLALLLHRALFSLLRLLGRTAVGLAGLLAFSLVGPSLGVTLGVNLLNALVLGLLGLPGFGLLLLLNWAF